MKKLIRIKSKSKGKKLSRKKYRTDIEEIMEKGLISIGLTGYIFDTGIRSKYGYRPDFMWPDIKFGIECDGEHWHKRTKKQFEHDRKKNGYFKSKEWMILHFSGTEIKTDIHTCINKIKIEIRRRKKKYGNNKSKD
ncbi:DUF559 domain-containing protein [Candidatus Pacearchaeota archaeon]|nr:DUF559 domain-containing protein [Candidatus Pacearchaeota archaeon]